MTTGVIDKNGIEISVGDIVHYRGKGLCACPLNVAGQAIMPADVIA